MAEEQPSYQYRVPKTVINVLSLAPGTRVRLVGGAIAEVVTNPQDGVWLRLVILARLGQRRWSSQRTCLRWLRPQDEGKAKATRRGWPGM